MPLNLFYTMVQKSQKWPKTQIKGGVLRGKDKTWNIDQNSPQSSAAVTFEDRDITSWFSQYEPQKAKTYLRVKLLISKFRWS